jgi:HK97 family phage major capsid protein
MGDMNAILDQIRAMGGDLSAFIKSTDGKLNGIDEEQTALRQRLNDLRQEVAVKGVGRLGSLGGSDEGGDTLGARFVKGFDAETYRKTGKLRVDVGQLWTKTVTTAGTGTRANAGVAPIRFAPLRVRQLMNSQPTSASSVDFARMGVYTNAAAIVAEGAQKPESNANFIPVNVTVQTIAHWILCSKQSIADLPTLQNLIDTLLLSGLEIRVEDYLLNDATAGVNTLAPAIAAPTGTAVDRVRAAIGQVENGGWTVNAAVLHPADWESMEIAKDSQQRYILNGVPGNAAAPLLWSKPVVVSTAQPAGTALVGDFAVGSTIFDRENASIIASDEDRDNLVKNMVTILCETRLALAVQVPGAFRKVALA